MDEKGTTKMIDKVTIEITAEGCSKKIYNGDELITQSYDGVQNGTQKSIFMEQGDISYSLHSALESIRVIPVMVELIQYKVKGK